MSKLFLTVVNMSITSSYVIIMITLVRLLLKGAPKIISYALWGIAAFRLVVPISFESIYSLIPRIISTGSISGDVIVQNPTVGSNAKIVDVVVNESIQTVFSGTTGATDSLMEMLTVIWLTGIAAMLIYSIVSILRLKKSLKSARLTGKNIYEVENLRTPFVLGFAKAKIYLPAGIGDEEKRFVMLHEQTHISRKDHIIKILAFLILSVHWFNPFAWLAFRLMSIDMELSCDEHVLQQTNENSRCSYANSLVSLAVSGNGLNSGPISFGEDSIKRKIKNVLNYKKRSFWMIACSVVAASAVGVGLLTNPVGMSSTDAVKIFGTQPYRPEVLIYLAEFNSSSDNTFLNDVSENEYTVSMENFTIRSEIEREFVQINMPAYKEENVGDSVAVNGYSSLDTSKYSDRRCFRIMTADDKDTGYAIYKLDDEVWISHWGLYGENNDLLWCEYILKCQVKSLTTP